MVCWRIQSFFPSHMWPLCALKSWVNLAASLVCLFSSFLLLLLLRTSSYLSVSHFKTYQHSMWNCLSVDNLGLHKWLCLFLYIVNVHKHFRLILALTDLCSTLKNAGDLKRESTSHKTCLYMSQTKWSCS